MNTTQDRKKQYDEAKKEEQENRLKNAPKSVTGTPLDQEAQFHPDTRHMDNTPNGMEIGDGGQTSHKAGGHSSAEKSDSSRGGRTSGAGSHPVDGAFGKEE